MKRYCKKLKVSIARGLSVVMLTGSVPTNAFASDMELQTKQNDLPIEATDLTVNDNVESAANVYEDNNLNSDNTDIDNLEFELSDEISASVDSVNDGVQETETNIVSYSDGITGGSIKFDKNSGTITGCDSTVTQVVIPKIIDGVKVTKIGDYAFNGCNSLTEITFNGQITKIGNSAFLRTNISEIELDNTLVEIGDTAFSNSSLESIVIPDSVKVIGLYAFEWSKNLKSVKIGNGVEKIPDNCFYGCSELENVELSDSVKYIGAWSFYDYKGSKFVFPKNVEKIENHVLGSSTVKEIYIYGDNTVVSSSFFDYYSQLDMIFCPLNSKAREELESGDVLLGDVNSNFQYEDEQATYWVDRATGTIVKCELKGNELKIPEAIDGVEITGIGKNVFKQNTDLYSINIPDTVTKLDDNCFYFCLKLVDISGCNGITEIGDSCFYYVGAETVPYMQNLNKICDKAFYSQYIKEVRLGENVSYIGKDAFINNKYITIYCSPNTYAYIFLKNNGYNYNAGEELIKYGATGGNIYINKYSGEITGCDKTVVSAIIPERVNGFEIKGVASYAFNGCNLLKELILPDTIIYVNEYAIHNCTALKTLKLSKNINNISSYAINKCTALEELNLDIKGKISGSTVVDCKNLIKVTFGDNVTSVSRYAIRNVRVDYISLGKNISEINAEAINNINNTKALYAQCYNNTAGQKFLEEKNIKYKLIDGYITYPAEGGNVYISTSDGRVIYVDEEVTDVTIPTEIDGIKITSVYKEAFKYCSGLKTVSFGENIKKFEEGTFSYCNGITKFTITGEKTIIPSNLLNSAKNVVVYCKQNSTMEKYCKENDKKYICLGGEYKYEVTGGSITIDTVRGCVLGYSGYPTSIVIPEEINGVPIKEIEKNAFYNCGSLLSVVIPDTVTKIGDYAFYNARGISDIKLSENIESVGKYCFYNCINMNLAQLPNNILEIGDYAFAYCKKIQISQIPDSVTQLGNYVFQYCESINKINIGDNINYIPDNCFYCCKNLETVVFNNVKSIEQYAFYGCTKLKLDKLSDKINNIGYCSFYNCTNLSISEIPDNVIQIDPYAFDNTAIESIRIGKGITYTIQGFDNCKLLREVIIDNTTANNLTGFANCASLESIIIPYNITSIGSDAFSGCTKLANVSLSENLEEIGVRAFNNCSLLKIDKIPDSVNFLGSYSFCNTGVEEIYIGTGVETINSYAFSNCNNLKKAVIANATTIREGAFNNSTALEYIELPDKLKYVGDYAFQNTAVKELKLGVNVDTLGTYVLDGCSAIENVYIYNSDLDISSLFNTIPQVTIHCYDNSKAKTFAVENNIKYVLIQGEAVKKDVVTIEMTGGNIYVSESNGILLSADSTVEKVDLTASNIQINSIANEAFYNCTVLKSVKLTDSVKRIGDFSFGHCSELTEINLNKVENIGERAFFNCKKLSDVAFENLTDIGNYSFYNCAAISKISLPKSMKNIGSYVFQNCTSLKSADLGNAITVSSGMFYGCVCLENVNLENAVNIENYAFYNCNSLTYINLDNAINIKDCAFDNCQSLANINLSNVVMIGKYAFRNCCLITNADLSSALKIDEGAFYDCESIEKLSLGSVSNIGYDAFGRCTQLKEVIIPSSVTSLDISAFRNSYNISTIIFEEGIKEVNYSCFSDNYKIKLIIPDSVNSINIKLNDYNESLIICCNKGSYAETYAKENNIKYILNNYVLEYSVEGGKIYINPETGTVVMADSTITAANIPAQIDGIIITDIGTIFRNNTNLKNVILPETVTSISANAFNNCSSLESVTAKGNITSIGLNSFMYCNNLVECNATKTAISIGEKAFWYCEKLNNVELNPELVSLGGYAFGYTGLKSIKIPDTITKIETEVFYNSQLENVDLGKNVKEISDYAFYNCVNLKSINLSDSIQVLGKYCFIGCNLNSVILPKSLIEIDTNPFDYTDRLFYVYPNSVGLDYVAEYDLNYRLLCQVNISAQGGGTVDHEGKIDFIYGNNLTINAKPDKGNKVIGVIVSGNNGKEIYKDNLSDKIVIKNITEDKSVKVIFGNELTAITDIEFEKDELVFEYGCESQKIKYTVYPENATIEDIKFVSNDLSVVSIDANGRLVPRGVGETTVLCTSADGTVSKTLKVRIQDTVKPVFYSKPEATIVAGTVVGIKWGGAGDVAGIQKYIVLRNGQLIAETTDLSYLDINLENETDYTYEIKAVDINGNESDPLVLNVTTCGASNYTQPYPVTDSVLGGKNCRIGVITSKFESAYNIDFKVSYSTDGVTWTDFSKDEIIGATLLDSNEIKFTAKLDVTKFKSGMYTFRYIISDSKGNSDEVKAIYILDNTVPNAVSGVSGNSGEMENILLWDECSSADCTGYYVYRSNNKETGFVKLDTVNSKFATYYADRNVESDEKYYYYITAFNKYDIESEPSEIIELVTLKDTQLPEILGLNVNDKATEGFIVSGNINVKVRAVDNYKLSKIELWYSVDDGKSFSRYGLNTVSDNEAVTTFNVDTAKFNSDKVIFKAACEDCFGNRAESQNTYSFLLDNTPPEKVTGLRAQVQATIITLKWNDVTAEDRDYFIVEEKVNGEFIQIQKVSDKNGCNIMKATPEKTYTYRVCAVDIYGNKGEYSNELTVTTKNDTFNPVVKDISPKQSAYNDKINVTVSVEDDYAVDYVEIYTSTDAKNWSLYKKEDVDELNSVSSISTVIDVSLLNEGSIFVKAIPVDYAGNRGDEDTTYVQYLIDHTAPKAPTVVVKSYENSINLTWSCVDNDVVCYDVYKSIDKEGNYSIIRNRQALVGIYDYTCLSNTEYYYYVVAYDAAGNASEKSEIVTVALEDDVTKPEVSYIYPNNNSTVNKTKNISVLFTDNVCLEKAVIQYLDITGQWKNITDINISGGSYVAEFRLNNEMLNENKVKFRAYAVDTGGNVGDYYEFGYNVNLELPVITQLQCTPDVEFVEINAVYENNNIANVVLYRMDESSVDRQYVYLYGEYPNKNGKFTYVDKTASSDKSYSYKLVVTNIIGNTAYEVVSGVKSVKLSSENDKIPPEIVMDIPNTIIVGAGYYYDATASTDNLGISDYKWDFGDGATSISMKATHIYDKTGVYTIKLTVTDIAGNYSTVEKEILVKDKNKIGTVNIKVIDNYGNSVKNAGVYVNIGTDNMYKNITDSDGVYKLVEEEGVYNVGIYADGYLPVKKSISVTGKITKDIIIKVVKEPLVVGELTHHKMTLEEIKEAGIDITKNENKYVYEFNVDFKIEEKVYNYTYYSNSLGIIGNNDYVIHTDEYTYKIDAHYINIGNSEPRTVVTLIKIPCSISWVKDFFEVQLTVINQADSEFYIKDSESTLNVPKGLTLVEANGYCSTAKEKFGAFYGGSSHTTKWILRGDKAGSYDISANFDGVLADFNENVHFEFMASEPIVVDAGNNIKMTVVCEDIVGGDFDYAMKIGLTNLSDSDIPMSTAKSTVLGYSSVEEYKETTAGKLTNENLANIKPGETLWNNFIISKDKYEDMIIKGNPNRENKLTPGKNRNVTSNISIGDGSNVEIPSNIENTDRFSFCDDVIEIFKYDGKNIGEPLSTEVIENNSLNDDFSITQPGYAIRVRRHLFDGTLKPIKTNVRIISNDGSTKTYMTDSDGFIYSDSEIIQLGEDDWSISKDNSVGRKVFNYTVKTNRGYNNFSFIGADARNGEAVLSGRVIGWKDGKAIPLSGFTVKALGLSTKTDIYGNYNLKLPNKGNTEVFVTGKYDNITYAKKMKIKLLEKTEQDFELGLKSDGMVTYFGNTVIEIAYENSETKDYSRVVLPEGTVDGVITFKVPIVVVNSGENYKIKSLKGFINRIDGSTQSLKFKYGNTYIGSTENDLIKLDYDKVLNFTYEAKDFKYGDKVQYEMILVSNSGIEFPVYGEPEFYVPKDPLELEYSHDLTLSKDGFTLKFSTANAELDISGFEDFLGDDIAVGKNASKGNGSSAGNLADEVNKDSNFKFSLSSLNDKVSSGHYEIDKGEYTLSTSKALTLGKDFTVAKYDIKSSEVEVTAEKYIDEHKIYDPKTDEWVTYYGGGIGGGFKTSIGLPDIPIYAGVALAIDLAFTGATKFIWEGNNSVTSNTALTKTALIPNQVSVGIGAEATAMVEVLKGLVGLGGYLGLSFDYLSDEIRYSSGYQLVTAGLKTGFKEKLFWIVNLSQEAYDGKWNIIDTRRAKGYSLDDSDVELFSVVSCNEERSWNGKISNSEATNLMTGAFDNNMLSIVELNNGTKLMTFVDFADNDEANPIRLKYSVYDNGKWSEPKVVCEDGTVDMAPVLEKTENGARVMWVNMNNVLSNSEKTLSKSDIINNYLDKMSVYSSEYNYQTKSWSEQVKLSNDNEFSYAPDYASTNTSSLTAYVSSCGLTATSDNPAKLNFIYAVDDQVVSGGVIGTDAYRISDVNVGYDKSGYCVVYKNDVNSLIYYTRYNTETGWSYPKRISSNSSCEQFAQLVCVEDNLLLYYVKDNSIYCKNITENTEEYVVISSDKTGLIGGLTAFVDSSGEEITLGWYGAVNGIYQVVVSRYDEENQCFGEGIVVSRLDNRTIPSALEIEVEPDGINTYYTAMTLNDDNTENVAIKHIFLPMTSDLTPVGAESIEVVQDKECEMIVDIENIGLAATSDFTVLIADNVNGDNPISTQVFSSTVLSGGNTNVSVNYTVPKLEDNFAPDLYVIVKADNDLNSANDYIKVDISNINLDIINTRLYDNIETKAVVSVKNKSIYNSDSFKVVARDTKNGNVINEVIVDNISAAQSQDIKLIIGDLTDECYTDNRAILKLTVESLDGAKVYDSDLLLLNKSSIGASSLAKTTYALIEVIGQVDENDGELLDTIEANISVMNNDELAYLTNIQTYYAARAEYDKLYGKPVIKYGDVNKNGTVDAVDAAITLQYALLNSEAILSIDKKCADVDNDNKITANDSALILQKTLKGEYIFPVEKIK